MSYKSITYAGTLPPTKFSSSTKKDYLLIDFGRYVGSIDI